MATKGLVRWWRDGERLLVDVNGTNVEARWLKFEEQLVTVQCGPHRCFDEAAPDQSRAGMPARATVVRDEYAIPYEDDPLLDECLW